MAKKLISQTIGATKHFFVDRLVKPSLTDTRQVARGQAAIISLNKQRVAVYKDELGAVYALSPVCSHLKCIVGWNSKEKTWDCPCHGSRFKYDGTVIQGPAKKDLSKIDL